MQALEENSDKISLLSKRNLERKLDLQKRKDEKSNVEAVNEKLGYFEDAFNNKKTQIENLIEQARSFGEDQLPDHFNNISKEILSLQKYAANSNLFLRTYDIKRCQENLQELTVKAKELEDELIPKKKFGFKNKSKPKPKKIEEKDEVDFRSNTLVTAKDLCGFVGKTNEVLVMSGKETDKKDITAECLENCTLKFFGCPSTLHLNHLKNCYVFTGPVSTSIFAEDCQDCTFVIACQQLRLHSSRNVNIYLHVTSRAIMEDCHGVFIAPYNWTYEELTTDFKQSGLDISQNNWTSIDDFNWLQVEKQSPNWSILEESARITNWQM